MLRLKLLNFHFCIFNSTTPNAEGYVCRIASIIHIMRRADAAGMVNLSNVWSVIPRLFPTLQYLGYDLIRAFLT
jgi:hypothetical protein